ncbi:hypothetical protein BKH46_06270 [Helicobacter sp. 12S02634-8]|uniref:tetratricopeptide repeat protein n=1 Tax=Helicobacter sp. 12S02634-8 TaxID=1476199 RepID=UPI000BA6A2B8|nr:tetratricopeptide repeat protein [Helicobacter sp. 12S02634-8]PAF46816.1 hypothetical protein BKH46_06270 [Helicobacter sp. 12S02634-8]
MSFKTITLASIYELQGFKEEALEIYKNILKTNPEHPEAQSGYQRLSQKNKDSQCTNTAMRDLFISASTPEEFQTIERYLMRWN